MKIKRIFSIFLVVSSLVCFTIKNIEVMALDTSKINFQKVSVEDGLSSTDITCIYQDNEGYIWIGTSDGLNKYDGNEIETYKHDIKNKKTLSSTYISNIEEDSKGNLWIGTDSGLNILNKRTNEIMRIGLDKTVEKKLSHFNITSIFKDSNDVMWIGTENGLNKYDSTTGEFQKFYYKKNSENSLSHSSITDIEEDDNGYLWVGTKSGVNSINLKTNEIKNKYNTNYELHYIYDLQKDNKGNIWIATKSGILKYDTLNAELKTFNINIGENMNTEVDFIMSDINNDIWMSGSNGAIKYSEKNERTNIFKHNPYDEKSISSNSIKCFLEDSNGIIWIGTNNGVSMVSNTNQFEFLGNNMHTDGTYTIDNVTYLYKDSDGDFWIGTDNNGLYQHKTNQKTKKYSSNNKNNQYSSLSNNIKSITEIAKGIMLVSTDKGLNVIHKETGIVDYHLIKNNYIVEIDTMYTDEDRIIWIGSNDGLYSYDIKKSELKSYNDNFSKYKIGNLSISCIYQDSNNKDILWLGGENKGGLIKFHKTYGILKNYTHNNSNSNSLSYDDINCITSDGNGNLWIGTNIGLNKFNIKDETFINYTVEDGLKNDYINGLLLDSNKNPWLSTNNGLSKFDIKRNKFINFTEMDGLQGMKFNKNSYFQSENGNMFFGGTKGITYFNPENIVEPKHNVTKLSIGDILINGKKINSTKKEIVLNYNKNNIALDFFLPDYKNLNSTTYEYKLEGQDTDWVYSGSRNFVNYTSLKPGNYTFKVKARDGYGKSSNITSVDFKIKNPIWKTPLAYLIYLSVVIGIILYIWNYVKILEKLVQQKTMNLNKQLKENEKLSNDIIKKEKLKNNYFVNLSHELRTPLNVILSTVQLINSVSKDGLLEREKSIRYMNIIQKSSNNLLKIINDIIDSSKIDTGHYKINKKYVDIIYLVEETALNMSKFIEEKGLSIIIDPEIEEKHIYCDPTEIERCIINLLANSVKFTLEGGEIRVYIKQSGDNINIIVEDTGIGISEEDQEVIFNRFEQAKDSNALKSSSSGIGLTLVRQIVTIHRGSIKLESELNKGSRFTITLPINEK
ncbi:MAG: two-component regulator propeller domain-containing protein [Romboutsia sp.]